MQGFNMGRYVPPDQEGVTTGNRLHGKHPLGARASRLASHGALTVRFEMPFAVWCGTCRPEVIIGQGTRFNAEKSKVGAYHTTPIFAFRMRHAACGGVLEIRTDPQNTAYVVVSGGKRRDTGGDGHGDSLVARGSLEGGAILTDAERADQRESAFGRLEKTIADREQLGRARLRVEELHDVARRDWDDPYARNQRLRRAFRTGRRAREKDAAADQELQDRLGLGIDLLPATHDDTRRAALVDFGEAPGDHEESGPNASIHAALSRPLFMSKRTERQNGQTAPPKGLTTLKSETAASSRREGFVAEIVENTRAARDPFLDFGHNDAPKGTSHIKGIKRKRVGTDGDRNAALNTTPVVSSTTTGNLLVSYTSDSE